MRKKDKNVEILNGVLIGEGVYVRVTAFTCITSLETQKIKHKNVEYSL